MLQYENGLDRWVFTHPNSKTTIVGHCTSSTNADKRKANYQSFGQRDCGSYVSYVDSNNEYRETKINVTNPAEPNVKQSLLYTIKQHLTLKRLGAFHDVMGPNIDSEDPLNLILREIGEPDYTDVSEYTPIIFTDGNFKTETDRFIYTIERRYDVYYFTKITRVKRTHKNPHDTESTFHQQLILQEDSRTFVSIDASPVPILSAIDSFIFGDINFNARVD